MAWMRGKEIHRAQSWVDARGESVLQGTQDQTHVAAAALQSSSLSWWFRLWASRWHGRWKIRNLSSRRMGLVLHSVHVFSTLLTTLQAFLIHQIKTSFIWHIIISFNKVFTSKLSHIPELNPAFITKTYQ